MRIGLTGAAGALVLAIAAVAALPGPACACTCQVPQVGRVSREADIVLTGRMTTDPLVQGEDPGGIRGMTIGVVRVERVEKGRLGGRRATVRVYAADTRGGDPEGILCDCRQGIPVEDIPFRFFLKRDPDHPDIYRVILTRYAGPD